jgi:hypothetical protein
VSATTGRLARTITGLPACPAWCRGDCVGGEMEHIAEGLDVPTDRLHERTLAEMVVSDGDSNREQDRIKVRLFVERLDSVEEDAPAPMVTRVVLDMDRRKVPAWPGRDEVYELTRDLSERYMRSLAAHTLMGIGSGKRVAMTSVELRHLAHVALEAADLLDAADEVEAQ